MFEFVFRTLKLIVICITFGGLGMQAINVATYPTRRIADLEQTLVEKSEELVEVKVQNKTRQALAQIVVETYKQQPIIKLTMPPAPNGGKLPESLTKPMNPYKSEPPVLPSSPSSPAQGGSELGVLKMKRVITDKDFTEPGGACRPEDNPTIPEECYDY